MLGFILDLQCASCSVSLFLNNGERLDFLIRIGLASQLLLYFYVGVDSDTIRTSFAVLFACF